MKLAVARICIDCEEIYEGGMVCPSCTSKSGIPLSRWIQTMADYESNKEEVICERISSDLSYLPLSQPA